MISSRTEHAWLLTGLALLLGVAGISACGQGEGGAAAGEDSPGDPPASATADVPGGSGQQADAASPRRYTDRELDLAEVNRDSSRGPRPGRDSASVARKVADARRAGPTSIADAAHVIDRAAKAGGVMLPLREGTNDWVCVPDDPVTPVDDPVCLNRVAQKWASGYYRGLESFRHEGLGVGYKLQGGALASNTDPFLVEPLEGDSWIIEPPHILLVFQDTTGLGDLPDGPARGGPWVSWRGTPYMTVKVPIAP